MSRKGYKHVKHDELIIINDIGRVCNACPHFKRWEEFPLNKGCKTGYRGTCKECKNKIKVASYNRIRKKAVKPVIEMSRNVIKPEKCAVNQFLMGRI